MKKVRTTHKKLLSLLIVMIMLVSIAPANLFSVTASAVSGSEIVRFARENCLDKPYVAGTAGPNSFDCSGLTKYVFGQFGITLPHSTYTIWNNVSAYGTLIDTGSIANAKTGDLILWYEHVAIYTENGNCIEALNPNYGVTEKVPVNSHTNGMNYKVIRVYGVSEVQQPADIGDDFYGVILNTKAWKPITCCDDGFVRMGAENGTASQVWYFDRQSDGSYVITSAATGKALEMYLGDTSSYNPTAAPSYFWGGNYQKWNFYAMPSGGYIIESKHYPELNLVLDMCGNDSSDGTTVITYPRHDHEAQIWSVYGQEDVQMKAPTLSVKVGKSSSSTVLLGMKYMEKNSMI